MWVQLTLLLLVGSAWAANSPAWKPDNEYIYQLRGRTLASLNQISNNYTGIVLKANLHIRPRPDGNLGARISEVQYAQVHSTLMEGWEQAIPESELSYKQIPISSQPFQITLKNGAIKNLVVSQQLANWEANFLKGVVSQLQLDTAAENLLPSSLNTLTQDRNNAVFKSIEPTVVGKDETVYEIHPLSEHVLQTEPWLAPLRHLKANGKLLEVIKTKDFSNSKQRPAFYFGLEGVDQLGVKNQLGEFFSRSVLSRAVLTGNLNSFTIQSSVTYDQIAISPTQGDKQKGSVNSKANVTLLSVEKQSQPFNEVTNPVIVDLVYKYNQPHSQSNQPRSLKNNYNRESGSPRQSADYLRYKRSFGPTDDYDEDSDSSSQESQEELYDPSQGQPSLEEAPDSPLLPFTVGYNGQSIGMQQNVPETARKLAQQIAQEFQDPEESNDKDTPRHYLILTDLVRVMSKSEISSVANSLKSQQSHGVQADAWVAFRDAVAQAGTGPALLNVIDWLQQGTISEEEAAYIVASTANSARQPTEQYMKTFFEKIIRSESIMSQKALNVSAMLAYSKLVSQVYFNKEVSHNKFPVHSFGSFRTEKGQSYVRDNVIPHLVRQLQEAINNADTQNIHLYIRALGNVGHPQILQAFKPYLEGTKQVSQFQRALMVISLDQLVENYPTVARSVLFKIYQNPSDDEQVRAAAVYRLLRTNPTTSMLQRMAVYTNDDPSSYVSSAVKSAIQTSAQLDGDRHAKLRAAAQAAEPFLTSQDFGVQYSELQWSNLAAENMGYIQSVETYGGEDSTLPKGIGYFLRKRSGSVKQPALTMQGFASSLEDLVNVYEQQMKGYQRLVKEKQAQRGDNQKWSSEYTAKLLNMQNEQREQLEAFGRIKIGNIFEDIWSLDNQTIANLSEVMQELEHELQEGKQLAFSKMAILDETIISLPTALGLPFIYTYAVPGLINWESEIQGNANPAMSSGEETLQKPETVQIKYKVQGHVSLKVQSQLGFFTPFDHKRYSAGYDKNVQMVVPPLSGKVFVDVENHQFRFEVENIDNNQDVNLINFTTLPYTTQHNIYSLNPEISPIYDENPQEINALIGEKSTGIGLNVHVTSDQQLDLGYFLEKWEKDDILSVMLQPWLDENIQHLEFTVGINSAKSPTDKVIIEMAHQSKEPSNMRVRYAEQGHDSNPIAVESWGRQKRLLKDSMAGISNVHGHVVDTAVWFVGQGQKKYAATMAIAKSDIDPKGRILVELQKQYGNQKPQKVSLSVQSEIPNISHLNIDQAIQSDATISARVAASIDRENGSPVNLGAHVKWSKSQDRQRYLKEQPEYKQCQRHMQEGNNQAPVCESGTVQAGRLDQFLFHITYQNPDGYLANQTYKLYSGLRHLLYPRFSENIVLKDSQSQSSKDRIEIEGQFSPDLNFVDVSISSPVVEAKINNVPLDDWASAVFVPHPVYHAPARLLGSLTNLDTFRPTCIVDQSLATTLDNLTYPLSLPNDWTVLLHYIPRRPSPKENQPSQSVLQQLQQYPESFIVYTRAAESNRDQKEVKIVIQTPETLSKVVEITLKPGAGSQYHRLFIGDEEVRYDEQGSHIYDGYMQVYALPNQEVKAEIYDSFEVVYDGVRAKLIVLNDKFMDAVRGLCGTFTGEPETDFTSPQNCILSDPQAFVRSYSTSEGARKKRNEYRSHGSEQPCYQKSISYIPLISSKDSAVTRNNEFGRSRSRLASQQNSML